MTARVVQKSERDIASEGIGSESSNVLIERGAIESRAHQQHRQVCAELAHVSKSVVHNSRLHGGTFRILHQRKGKRNVARYGVDGHLVGVDVKSRGLFSE